jgi:hypothetical protein
MFLGDSLTEILPAAGLLLLFAIVGSVIILRLRKKFTSPPNDAIPFGLGELKKMHEDGVITLEEYDRAKQSIIDSMKESTTDSQNTHRETP